MGANQPKKSVTYVKRVAGAALALLPLALLIASLIAGIAWSGRPPFAGVGFMAPGAGVAAINAYLSFIRPSAFSIRRGSLKGYRHVSGIPLVGTFLLCVGAALSFGATGSALVGIAAFVLDTGSSGWLLLALWRDRAFWEA